MLRWFFYIFCLLYILCNLYVCTRRIRNECVYVCVCNYFLYIRIFFKKLYEYANANAARAAFAICLLYRFWHLLFCSNSFLLFFIQFFFLRCFFVRHVNFGSVAQKIMYTALCGRLYVYRMWAIKYLTHEILNKLNFLLKNHNKHAA